MQHYYLRARCYNPSNGLFNRVDPYSGNPHDPQSLHKYLYCHANPVNGIDPTGLFFIATAISTLWTHTKMLGMRTKNALQTWRQYNTAKKLMTVVGVSYVISTAFIDFLSGSSRLDLRFSESPLLSKKWPDVTLAISTDRRFFEIIFAWNAQSQYDPDDGTVAGGGAVRLYGKINLKTGAVEGIGGGARLTLQLYPTEGKHGPIKAKLYNEIKGPPFTIETGLFLEFYSPFKSLYIRTGFPLLKVQEEGLSILWGKPLNIFGD